MDGTTPTPSSPATPITSTASETPGRPGSPGPSANALLLTPARLCLAPVPLDLIEQAQRLIGWGEFDRVLRDFFALTPREQNDFLITTQATVEAMQGLPHEPLAVRLFVVAGASDIEAQIRTFIADEAWPGPASRSRVEANDLTGLIIMRGWLVAAALAYRNEREQANRRQQPAGSGNRGEVDR